MAGEEIHQFVAGGLSPEELLTFDVDSAMEKVAAARQAEREAQREAERAVLSDQLAKIDGELKAATGKQDAMAADLYALAERHKGDWRRTDLADGKAEPEHFFAAEFRAQRVDYDMLALQAARHETVKLVGQYQQAKERGQQMASGKLANQIMLGVAAERDAGSKLTASAVRAAKLDWATLRQDANRHAVNQAPAEAREALQATGAYIDARREAVSLQRSAAEAAGGEFGEARLAPEVIAAYREADVKAAQVLKLPDAEAAAQWWNEREKFLRGDQAGQPVTMDQLHAGAARYHASMDFYIWQATHDEATRNEIAAKILDQLDAERTGEGRKWMAAAMRQNDVAVPSVVEPSKPVKSGPVQRPEMEHIDAQKRGNADRGGMEARKRDEQENTQRLAQERAAERVAAWQRAEGQERLAFSSGIGSHSAPGSGSVWTRRTFALP